MVGNIARMPYSDTAALHQVSQFAFCFIRRVAVLLAAMMLTACASSDRYMGISFAPGAAPPEVQEFARRAREGDKEAQYRLGTELLDGRRVPIDWNRGLSLLRSSAASRGGKGLMVVPGSNGAMSSQTVHRGPYIPGNPKAIEALEYWNNFTFVDPNGPKASEQEVVQFELGFRACAPNDMYMFENPDHGYWEEMYRELQRVRVCIGRKIKQKNSMTSDRDFSQIVRCYYRKLPRLENLPKKIQAKPGDVIFIVDIQYLLRDSNLELSQCESFDDFEIYFNEKSLKSGMSTQKEHDQILFDSFIGVKFLNKTDSYYEIKSGLRRLVLELCRPEKIPLPNPYGRSIDIIETRYCRWFYKSTGSRGIERRLNQNQY